MKADVRVQENISRKTEKPYKCLIVKLENGHEIMLFPHPAEIALIEQYQSLK